MSKSLSRARSIADVTSGTILASVEIAVAPERVFRALTASEEIVRWWGSAEVYQTTHWESDLRVHGRWAAKGKGADGLPFGVEGEFLEIDPPHKLVQTWKPSWDEGPATTVHYALEAIEGGTRLTVRHYGFEGRAESCRNHGDGWKLVLAWLTDFAEGQQKPAAATPEAQTVYFVRLIAPRPSFAMDMNAEERALMQQHGGYWRKQMGLGKVVVFGPVADPKGPWGLGIVRARDEQDMRAFSNGDPAIQANVGFKYEYLPMIQAVMPE